MVLVCCNDDHRGGNEAQLSVWEETDARRAAMMSTVGRLDGERDVLGVALRAVSDGERALCV